ncbi:MAG: class I SAM-dependent methyltransferase [Tepidiformaceae bacterium]
MTTIEITPAIDEAKAEAFAGRVLGIFSDSLLAYALSIGHQTGLNDALATLPPSTSLEVASATGLNERYVREWLAAMTTGRILEYDAATKRFTLPAEHAAFLTRPAGANNFAYYTQYIGLLGTVEPGIVECFRSGGGLGYDAYPGFQEIQRGDSAQVLDAALIDQVIPLVPGLRAELERGIDVADVGCGAGHAVNLLAREFPNSRFTGFDISDEGIGIARREAAEWGLSNAKFVVRDISEPGEPAAFDLVTAFDAIHDQARPRAVLANIHRALRPGGTYLMADFKASSNLEENLDHPLGGGLYVLSLMHCMTVSLAQGGEGLGTAWGKELALELLGEAGFGATEVKEIEGDVFNYYYISRK